MAVAKKKKATAPRKKAVAKSQKEDSPKKEVTPKSDTGKVALDDIIKNWNKMNEHLNLLSEEECLELLRLEQQGRRRVHMLNRIHARYTKLRSERERTAIMSGEDISPK